MLVVRPRWDGGGGSNGQAVVRWYERWQRQGSQNKHKGIGDLVNTAANLASKANSGADGKVVVAVVANGGKGGERWQRRGIKGIGDLVNTAANLAREVRVVLVVRWW